MAQAKSLDELLERVSQRDEAALGELYDELAPRLLGMLQRILANREAARQVLRESFLKLWNEARRLREGSASVSAWLAVRARTQAIGWLRKNRELPALPAAFPALLEKSFAWLPRSEEIALLDSRRDLLTKIVNQMPKAQREALELAVFEGYTEQEIAQKLNEPLGRVKTSLRAGLKFLKHRLRAVLGTWAANI